VGKDQQRPLPTERLKGYFEAASVIRLGITIAKIGHLRNSACWIAGMLGLA
jgi:hypothetical protein